MRLFCLFLLCLLWAPVPLDAGATAVHTLPLAGPAAERNAELSGLAWNGDELVLLPQYPDWRAPGGVLFALPKAALERAADGCPAPLAPREIALAGADIRALVDGFEGFEAIVFTAPDEAVLAIESHGGGRMHGFLLKGRMEEGGKVFRLLPETLTEIPLPVQLKNMAVEALVWDGRELTAFFEANGRNVNPAPVVVVFDGSLRLLGTRPAPALEYRLTDASAPDAKGRFWVINYFWPGERGLLRPPPEADAPAQVERLVRLRLTKDGVARDETAPIDLLPGDEPRNWEGIAELPGKGFLLVTDKHPVTILGFVSAH